MTTTTMIVADVVAITLLTWGLYFPRHRRKDLVVAFLVVNIGVLAVSLMLATTTVGLGLGLGLFGVLSIIRLRSSEIAQHEVAYYFAALAIGLIAGLASGISPLALGLMALILMALLVGDSPRLFRDYRQQVVVLDAAYPDEAELRVALQQLLGGQVHRLSVLRLDLVNDSTMVEVRYQVSAVGRRAALGELHAAADRSAVEPEPFVEAPWRQEAHR